MQFEKTQPREKRNLVFSSVGDFSKHGKFWLNSRSDKKFDLALYYFGRTPGKYLGESEFYEEREGSKWQNFSHFMKNYPDELNKYDAVFIVDDDIEIETAVINRLFKIFHQFDLWLAQPSFTPDSPVSFFATLQRKECVLHYVSFVECGVSIYSRMALQKCSELFSQSVSGWGIDIASAKLLGYPKDRIACIDEAPCRHPLRASEMDVILPRDKHRAEGEALLKRYGIIGQNKYRLDVDEYGRVKRRIHSSEERFSYMPIPFWYFRYQERVWRKKRSFYVDVKRGANQILRELKLKVRQARDLVQHRSAETLIIVIPYRNRAEHLRDMIPILRAHLKNIPHSIAVIEQLGDVLFNRAKLLNIGFDLYQERAAYFCFHDVDLIPADTCDYSYPYAPTAMVSELEYIDKAYIKSFWGGCVLFNKSDFKKMNGYSNLYFGWGCEDDDMYKRLRSSGLPFVRRSGQYRTIEVAQNTSSYDEAKQKRETNPHYFANLQRLGPLNNLDFLPYDWRSEGLNSLEYELVETVQRDGYTLYRVKA